MSELYQREFDDSSGSTGLSKLRKITEGVSDTLTSASTILDGEKALLDDTKRILDGINRTIDSHKDQYITKLSKTILLYDLAEKALEKNDIETACSLFKEAAEPDTVEDMYNWGVFYGRNKDFLNAIKWYEQASNKGYPEAQLTLGCYYYNGEVVPEDIPLALELIKKAKEAGNKQAEELLNAINDNDEKIIINLSY